MCVKIKCQIKAGCTLLSVSYAGNSVTYQLARNDLNQICLCDGDVTIAAFVCDVKLWDFVEFIKPIGPVKNNLNKDLNLI